MDILGDSRTESALRTLSPQNVNEAPDRRSPEFLKKMYDRVSVLSKIGVWECDLAAGELTWTDAVYDLFDLPRQSRLDRASTLDRYEPNCRRELERLRAEAIETCSSFTVDVSLRDMQGHLRWIRITGEVEQEAGQAVRIFGTKQDITHEKVAQQTIQALQTELIHASRISAIEAMRSTLAHELNQPLAGLALYVSAMRNILDKGQVEPAGSDVMEGIESCALKAGQIMREMRNMPMQEQTKLSVFNLDAAIDEACAIALKGNDHTVNLNYYGCHGLQAFGDPVQIQQVVINLIQNACEALSGFERRDIIITAQWNALDSVAEISVRDSGPGIAPAVAKTLFDSFVSTKPGSTGIGLSISRTIVESHSGKLIAENYTDGGAIFRFSIPSPPFPA